VLLIDFKDEMILIIYFNEKKEARDNGTVIITKTISLSAAYKGISRIGLCLKFDGNEQAWKSRMTKSARSTTVWRKVKTQDDDACALRHHNQNN